MARPRGAPANWARPQAGSPRPAGPWAKPAERLKSPVVSAAADHAQFVGLCAHGLSPFCRGGMYRDLMAIRGNGCGSRHSCWLRQAGDPVFRDLDGRCGKRDTGPGSFAAPVSGHDASRYRLLGLWARQEANVRPGCEIAAG